MTNARETVELLARVIMPAMAPVPEDHPLMIAWNAYKATDDFANTRKWAAQDQHLDGSLWAAFEQGYRAALAAHPAPAAEAEVEAVADMHREIVALTGWATMAEIEPKEAAFQDALRRLAAERAMHKNNALNWQDACNKADDAVAAAVAADNGHE
jgi:hypothetical protein